MELVLLIPESTAWEEAWTFVHEHPINEGLDEPSVALNEGQSWQYLGSWCNKGKAISSFRHRCHPKTGGLYNVSYSHELREDQIQKKFRI